MTCRSAVRESPEREPGASLEQEPKVGYGAGDPSRSPEWEPISERKPRAGAQRGSPEREPRPGAQDGSLEREPRAGAQDWSLEREPRAGAQNGSKFPTSTFKDGVSSDALLLSPPIMFFQS